MALLEAYFKVYDTRLLQGYSSRRLYEYFEITISCKTIRPGSEYHKIAPSPPRPPRSWLRFARPAASVYDAEGTIAE